VKRRLEALGFRAQVFESISVRTGRSLERLRGLAALKKKRKLPLTRLVSAACAWCPPPLRSPRIGERYVRERGVGQRATANELITPCPAPDRQPVTE